MTSPITVLGQVTTVIRQGPQVINYNVFSAEKNKTVTFVNTKFFPIEKGDLFYAAATINEEGEYEAEYAFCQIGDDDNSIGHCFFSCFHGPRDTDSIKALSCVEREAGSTSLQDIDVFLQKKAELRSQSSKTIPQISFIEGLSTAHSNRLLTHWYKKRNLRQLYLLGLGPLEIRAYYGSTRDLFAKLIDNPYVVPVITLEKCKDILCRLNREEEVTLEQERCGKMNRYLYQMSKNGHVFVEVEQMRKMFPFWDEYSETIVTYDLVVHDEKVYLKWIYCLQNQTLTLLQSLMLKEKWVIPYVEGNSKIKLTAEQIAAIVGSLSTSLSIITGGGGTGKTTIIKEIVSTLQTNRITYLLSSFTGKAVCRMRQVLDSEDPQTMHRFIHEARSKGKEGLIKPEVIIIDEISMVSTELFSDFISLYPQVKKVILVGDINQLPPIEWGYLTSQLLASKTIPLFTLTFVHRLCDGSLSNSILVNSQAVASGLFTRWIEGDEFVLDPHGDLEGLITAFHEQKIPLTQVRIIMPFKNSKLDLVTTINSLVQKVYLPNNRKIMDKTKNCWWKIKDQVILNENNAEMGLFNGQEGTVTNIYLAEKEIGVTFKNVERRFVIQEQKKRDINYSSRKPELSTSLLDLAYCLTVHKSQGSEWDFVILYCPPDVASSSFIDKKLIYTAITRAKRMCVLSGNIEVITQGAKKNIIRGRDDLGGYLAESLPRVIFDEEEYDYYDDDCYDD